MQLIPIQTDLIRKDNLIIIFDRVHISAHVINSIRDRQYLLIGTGVAEIKLLRFHPFPIHFLDYREIFLESQFHI